MLNLFFKNFQEEFVYEKEKLKFHKVLCFVFSSASMLCIPKIDAKAAIDIKAFVSGDDVGGAGGSYAEGISARKSGYMVYVVDQNGNRVSSDAKF